VFEAIKAKARADLANLPQHFSIEQCPAYEAELIARNEYLLRLAITPSGFLQASSISSKAFCG
jgi:hypothetical protein